MSASRTAPPLRSRRHAPQSGFALMFAVLAVLVLALATTVAVQRSAFQQQRDRELQLLFVGQQFRDAITRYAAAGSGNAGVLAYPSSLDDLLEDHRSPAVVRHLRRIYPDPMTGQRDWVLEKVQDRIVGVHSRSDGVPIRHKGFLPEWEDLFAHARSYRDWRFVADAYLGTASAAGASSSTASSAVPGATASSTGAGADASGNSSDASTSPATATIDPTPPASGPSQAATDQCQALYGKSQRGSCYGPGMSPLATQACADAVQESFIQCLQAASGQSASP